MRSRCCRNHSRAAHTLPAVATVAATAALAFAPAGAARAQKLIHAAPPPLPSIGETMTGTPNPETPSTALRVLFAGTPLTASDARRVPFRDPLDGQVCIAPESLASLGVAYMVDEKEGTVSLMTAETGRSVTVALRRSPDNGTPKEAVFVSAAETIEGLGGKTEYDAKSNTLYVRSVLQGVEILGGQLRVRASLPVAAKVSSSQNRKLIIIDVPGAEVGTLGKTLELRSPGVQRARTGQFQEDVARIVLEMDAPSGFFLLNDKATTLITLNPVPDRPGAGAIARNSAPATAPVAKPGGTPARTASAATGKKGAPPTFVRGITLERVSDTRARILVSAGSAPAVQTALESGRLTLNFLNATFGANVASALGSAQHPFIKGMQLIPGTGSAGQLMIDLTRAVNFQVRMNPNGGLIVELGMPKGAGGELAGKVVVVDAGHGGHDSGARGANGTYEKNVNLAIARRLADSLRDMDVNVIMTRDNDQFVELDERSFIANRAGADFFISVHADSARSSANGSTVYYHLNTSSCRTLAQCIGDRLRAMGTIRTNGPRSDGKIYTNGFSVLRRSQMVSVLVECGFMSNGSDVRRLNDPNVQDSVAQAIADGLKDYVEGRPADFDSRFINPQAKNGTGNVSLPATAAAGMAPVPTTAEEGVAVPVSSVIPVAPATVPMPF